MPYMKLISVNIESNFHTDLVLAFLKRENADVICMQELLEEDVEMFKKELGFECIYRPVSYWKNPVQYPTLMGKKQGVGIFAKNIVTSGSVFYYGKEENILRPFEEYVNDPQKNYALAWIDTKGNDSLIYKFVTTHLPVTDKGSVSPFQLEVTDALISQLDMLGEFVLCGDTNAPRGGETFGRLAQKYKDNIPSEYQTSIDQNLHRVKGIQFMVDGLFTTPSYTALNVKLVDGVSDHMGVVADVIKN